MLDGRRRGLAQVAQTVCWARTASVCSNIVIRMCTGPGCCLCMRPADAVARGCGRTSMRRRSRASSPSLTTTAPLRSAGTLPSTRYCTCRARSSTSTSMSLRAACFSRWNAAASAASAARAASPRFARCRRPSASFFAASTCFVMSAATSSWSRRRSRSTHTCSHLDMPVCSGHSNVVLLAACEREAALLGEHA